ncbi:glycoside hydrolase family 9 protein [Pelagicoccus mobilis]|uniref:Glycoside hydrolase family 9 domain-containing protein n=1 Tax=Pelagicoccus mobilis TaxID=415221 RepID=A0A934VU84_9BACT|nr:glycoside hydrolase family 9 protein [Pelagicoccus mobilis]MBK1880493.1 hypothetical protein [Pelagicoccus mobilis]
MKLRALSAFAAVCASPYLHAAKVDLVKVVDRDYLMVQILDGVVEIIEKPETYSYSEETILYNPPLDTAQAATASNWTLTSNDDANYDASGQTASNAFRRTKLNGLAQRGWNTSIADWNFDTTFTHVLFLQLPSPLQQGASYTLEIAASTGADETNHTFTYDIFSSPTEAIHINLAGYDNGPGIKAADLYQWLGDGGHRDYSSFEGNTVYLHNVDTQENHDVGQVSFWQDSGSDAGNWNYTRSPVWNIDFSGFDTPGTYRLAVEGVGCSEDFAIGPRPRKAPFDTMVRGYFFMRIGQEPADNVLGTPRQPLYIPGEDPDDTVVYLTSMSPDHPDWDTFASGDKWDRKDEWAAYVLPGSPTNPNSRGGHSDAYDWDRHLAHVSNIYDILFPYFLSGGMLDDDDTGIAESGNGVPDAIDAARYEVDFFLSLKTEHGYGHGLNNPDGNNVFYQAAPTAHAAWANAVNAAMLADAYRIAGQRELMAYYRDAAIEAFEWAAAMDDPKLDTQLNVSSQRLRGRDLRLTAAAHLYNLTGDTAYEDYFATDSNVRTASNANLTHESHNQLYATVAYLTTQRTVNYPEIQANMRQAIAREAKSFEADKTLTRPTRRAADDGPCWFQTAQYVQRSILAHHVSQDPVDKAHFLDALLLEADWSLGRNPTNMIQMTTATTALADKRSVQICYSTGVRDGVPGMHPGHTPYMNIANWGGHMRGSNPTWMADQCYPDWSEWPHAEAHFETNHIWANGEFTPRQTMRGKFALYAYLYNLEKRRSTPSSFTQTPSPNAITIQFQNPEVDTSAPVPDLLQSEDLQTWAPIQYDDSSSQTRSTWTIPHPESGSRFWKLDEENTK